MKCLFMLKLQRYIVSTNLGLACEESELECHLHWRKYLFITKLQLFSNISNGLLINIRLTIRPSPVTVTLKIASNGGA